MTEVTQSEIIANLRHMASSFSIAAIEKASGVSQRCIKRYLSGERRPGPDSMKGLDKAWKSLFSGKDGKKKTQDGASKASKITAKDAEKAAAHHESRLNQVIDDLKKQRDCLIELLLANGFEIPRSVANAVKAETHLGFSATEVAHSGDADRKIYDIVIPEYLAFRFRLDGDTLSLSTAVSCESRQAWSHRIGSCHGLSDVMDVVKRHKVEIDSAVDRFIVQLQRIKNLRLAIITLHDLSTLGVPNPGSTLHRAVLAVKHAILHSK